VGSIVAVLKLIAGQVKKFEAPYVTAVANDADPYRVLVSCILSLRTKDNITTQAAKRLFQAADSPARLQALRLSTVRQLIYPVGFYRRKARVIRNITARLIREYGGRVPRARDELLSFKGVGRKTANLVLGLCFKIPAICVDTHVHRIVNRLGWVDTHHPYKTEIALEGLVPQHYWIKLNNILVLFGQHMCVPISPYCGRCKVNYFCKKKGVSKCR